MQKTQQLRLDEQQLDLFVAYLPGQELEPAPAPRPSELVCRVCGNPTVFVSEICRYCRELELPAVEGHAVASQELDEHTGCAYPLYRWICSCGTESGFWAAPTTAAQRWDLHVRGLVK